MPRNVEYTALFNEINSYLHGENELYNRFRNAMNGLLEKIDPFLIEGEDGYPTVSADDLRKIQADYAQLNTNAVAFRNSLDEDDPMRQLLNQILDLVEQDRKGLSSVRFSEGLTYPEIIEGVRKIEVKNPESGAKNVSGALNTRAIVETQNGQKGYFTKESTVKSPAGIISEYMDKLAREHPAYRKAFEALAKAKTSKGDPVLLVGLIPLDKDELETIKGQIDVFDEEAKLSLKQGILSFYHARLAYALGDDTADELFEQKEFLGALIDYHANGLPAAVSMETYQLNNISPGSNIEKRNAAMSTMAQMIGNPDLVAYSGIAVMKDGDKEVKGVFMEEAKGIDIASLEKKDSDPAAYNQFKEIMSDLKDDACWDTAEAKKQIADMQVLDYISGNTDRHIGNILYQFEKNGKGEYRLNKITGIDNDCAFGVWSEADNKRFPNLTRPSNFGVMRRDTAAHIMALDKETIRFMNHDKLSADELDAVYKRVQDVQKQIEKALVEEAYLSREERIKPRKNRLVLLDDDDFNKVSLKEIAKAADLSLFERINRDVVSLSDIILAEEVKTKMEARDRETAAKWNNHIGMVGIDAALKADMNRLRTLGKNEFVDLSKDVVVDFNSKERYELMVSIIERTAGIKLTNENNEADLAAYRGLLNHVCVDGAPYNMRFSGELQNEADRKAMVEDLASLFVEQMNDASKPVRKVTFLEADQQGVKHLHFTYRIPKVPEITAKQPGFFSWNKKAKQAEYDRQVKAHNDAEKAQNIWKQRNKEANTYASGLNQDSYTVTKDNGTIARKPLVNLLDEIAEKDRIVKNQSKAANKLPLNSKNGPDNHNNASSRNQNKNRHSSSHKPS